MSSGVDLQALIAQLHHLPDGSTFADALGVLERSTESAAVTEARRRCALCRRFDREAFDFLCADMSERPTFDEFVASQSLQSQGPGVWALNDGTRERLLADWQSQATEWKSWNQRLGAYFAARPRADAQLDALYHWSACPEPWLAVEPFRRWYAEADERFDLAQCNALLEILRVQQTWRGPALSQEWREHSQYYTARLLFADDYFKTGSYLPRTGALDAMKPVLERGRAAAATDPWIFHLHATGGTGKTTFLRWLVSRHLVPARIPCARVDFDDFDLKDVLEYPLQLFLRIVEQWSRQVSDTGLNSLVEKLRHERSTPGWNAGLFDEVRRQFVGAQIQAPLVVVLDTLEEATVAAADWLSTCIATLRGIHQHQRNLRVILSGRYDLAARQVSLPDGEYVTYELHRFSKAEAQSYLERRGIPPGPVLDAIVERAGTDDPADAPVKGEVEGHNPFKLSIFAEIALNKGASLTEAEVKTLPSADVGYLLERVVKRIKSQPLRWVVRYGVIARHLTVAFIDEVLIPPMRKALRGEVADSPNDDLTGAYVDVWVADRDEAERVNGGALWRELQSYAQERGWITVVGTGDDAELRFHPEVVRPMRDLLRRQPIYTELQARAIRFFESQTPRAMGFASEREKERSLRALREVIFHRFQLDGPAARQYWSACLHDARQWGTDVAATVAEEITGRDYAEGGRYPFATLLTAETLAEAHVEAADLALQAAGADFSVSRSPWPELRQHVELADLIGADCGRHVVPHLLRTICTAWNESDPERTVKQLQKAADGAPARERFFFELHLARCLSDSNPAAAAVHYREALAALEEGAPRTGVTPFDIESNLATVYEQAGAHVAATGAQARARTYAGDDTATLALVVERQAEYALRTGDTNGAAERLKELAALQDTTTFRSPVVIPRLRSAVALATSDIAVAQETAAAALGVSRTELERADSLERLGDISAVLLDFKSAVERFESAATSYDRVGSLDSGWCTLKSIRLHAFEMGSYETAESLTDTASRLRSARDPRISGQVELLRAFVALKQGQRDEAARIFLPLVDLGGAWPAPVRAEMLIFGLLFGLLPTDESQLEDVLSAVEDVQPLTRRNDVLRWVKYADGADGTPEWLLNRLLPLFYAPKTDDWWRVHSFVLRADLCRVLKHAEAAAAQLERISGLDANASPMFDWEINRARLRLGLPTNFDELAARLSGTFFERTGLAAAIRCEAAAEALRGGNLDRCTKLVAEGFQPLEADLPSVWATKIRRVRADLDDARRPAAAAPAGAAAPPAVAAPASVAAPPPPAAPPMPAARRPSAPSAPVPPRPRELAIDAKRVPWLLQFEHGGIEPAIDRLLDGWSGFARELSQCFEPIRLDAGGLPPILPQGGLAALPWELASSVATKDFVWRSSAKSAKPGWARPADSDRRSVHIVRPVRHEYELNFEASSGADLEDLYAQRGCELSVSYNPEPSRLEEEIKKHAPRVVHIVAAMRESTSGIYLDFESTQTRAADLGQQSLDRKASELLLNAPRLHRILTAVQHPPFVILDIARPANLAEAVRMLMLRNLFATQLFDLRHVRGVLGVGLARPDERLDLAVLIIEPLLSGAVGDAMRALRATQFPAGQPWDQPLDRVLPRHGAALWMMWPDYRLFSHSDTSLA